MPGHRMTCAARSVAVKGAALLAAIFVCAGAAHGFGSINGFGQNAEHEQITRIALGCRAGNDAGVKDGFCFQPRSLDEMAGTRGTFGAVSAPDNPLTREFDKSEAHCDNAKLRECRDYIDRKSVV